MPAVSKQIPRRGQRRCRKADENSGQPVTIEGFAANSGGKTSPKRAIPMTGQSMRRTILAATLLLSPSIPALADSQNLTVVELFQSQGCSSCPPANANVIALSDRPDILTL